MLSFEEALVMMGDEGPRMALIDVGDTCEMALRWFHDHDIEPAASDLLEFARLVFSREER